jgi:hypothetical protein
MASPAQVEQLLANIFDQLQEVRDPIEHARRRQDFVFHMTDWLSGLEGLADLFAHPSKRDKDAAGSFVAGFLYHVIPHLKEAGRLLLDYAPPDNLFQERNKTVSTKTVLE